MIGYGNRTWGNKGIHDNLTATAIAFQDDESRIVIIACDLLAFNEYTLEKVKKITKEKIVICCSHTHSGPIVYADEGSKKINQLYVDYLVTQLASVATEALMDVKPVSLIWG